MFEGLLCVKNWQGTSPGVPTTRLVGTTTHVSLRTGKGRFTAGLSRNRKESDLTRIDGTKQVPTFVTRPEGERWKFMSTPQIG